MKRGDSRRGVPLSLLGAIAGVLALAALGAPFVLGLVEAYERVAYVLAPSAERAFAYGERHFDASSNPGLYDIARAERYFERALLLDPQLPYVQHELARIAFLRGDFPEALSRIDRQIEAHGDATPNSYYIRGLIEGYMGNYGAAIEDYRHFLLFDPHDWAGVNDYAWVLLKAKHYEEALQVTANGLYDFPGNPWLLNSNAIALYQTGHPQLALLQAKRALEQAGKLSRADWLHAYPGNDPKIAATGLATFRQAAADNIHMIELALASSTVQSR